MDFYLWIKAFHIFAVLSWMAGMFYLPRLFVYHIDAQSNGELATTLELMEQRLMKIIMAPAVIAVWLSGIAMIITYPSLLGEAWLHPKLACVATMTWLHMACVRWRKQLAAGTCEKTSGFFRKVNEIPTVLALIIVSLAVVKPF